MKKEELLLKLIEMLMGDESPKSQEKQMIGQYVIVRCRDAGVHAGFLESYEGREVVLSCSRRLWYWKAANNAHTLSGVAKHGLRNDSKIPAEVRSIVLPEACEIILCSDASAKSIQEMKEHAIN